MMTQTNLFDPADEATEGSANADEGAPVLALASAIAVPCGFVDRYSNRCQRLGNWPVIVDGKQLLCRGRPMVHCDPACFKGEAPVKTGGMDDDDIVWEDRLSGYGDEQPD